MFARMGGARPSPPSLDRKGMPRRVVNMLMYLVQHDAHHRRQITSLARDLGHPFASQDMMRIWGWKAMP